MVYSRIPNDFGNKRNEEWDYTIGTRKTLLRIVPA
jgi:hypothetical protein